MGYDIGRFESRKYSEEGVDFQIVHPLTGPVFDDAGKPVTIKLGGADSSRIKGAVHDLIAKRRGAAEAAREEGRPIEYGWEQKERDRIEDLATLTLGWSDNIELDGKPLAFSFDNAVLLYQRYPEIAEQMAVKAANRVNFMRASSKS
jgi:hypothetical protein